MDDAEFERLVARVDALEREVAQLKYGIGAAPIPPAPVPAVERVVVNNAQTQPAAPPPAPKPRRDLESILGGRGLLYAGTLLILLGVASFLKIAFDRGWVGPSMRVALGLMAGTLLIAGASAMRKRLHPYFADAIVGLGAGVAYLSLFAAGSLFHLLPLGVVSLGTIAVTGAVCVLAYQQNRQPLAFVGILGGLIAPLLLDGDGQDSLVLYTYLAALSSGAIVLGELRGWRAVPVMALVGTIFYWTFFAFEPITGKLALRVTAGVVLYALFASTMLLAWRRREPVDGWRIAVASINAIWFFFGIAAIAADHTTLLAAIFLAIAAAHLLAGGLLKQRQQFWLATIALSFAIPPICNSFSPVLPASTIALATHLAWVVEATMAGVLGARWNDRVLIAIGGALFATTVLHTLALNGVSDLKTLLNDRFISLIATVVGIAYVRSEAMKRGVMTGGITAVVRIAMDLLVLVAVTPEAERIGNAIGKQGNTDAGSVAISVVWALYGAALIAYGIARKEAVSRWDGLILLAITVLKVLLLDLTEFDIAFRVISALVLGVVMLVMAFLYQTRLRAGKTGDGS